MSTFYRKYILVEKFIDKDDRKVLLVKPMQEIEGMPERFVLKIFASPEMPLEVEIHKKLSECNENCLRLYDYWADSSYYYCSIEFCPNGDLHSLLEITNKPFDFSWMIDKCIELSFLLSLMHTQGIVHRDIKPLNIFLTADYYIKLGDFGEAKFIDNQNVSYHTIRGTNYYMSPELKLKELGIPNDPFRDDIWALGKSFTELALGRLCPEVDIYSLRDFIEFEFKKLGYPELFIQIVQGMVSESIESSLNINHISTYLWQLKKSLEEECAYQSVKNSEHNNDSFYLVSPVVTEINKYAANGNMLNRAPSNFSENLTINSQKGLPYSSIIVSSSSSESEDFVVNQEKHLRKSAPLINGPVDSIIMPPGFHPLNQVPLHTAQFYPPQLHPAPLNQVPLHTAQFYPPQLHQPPLNPPQLHPAPLNPPQLQPTPLHSVPQLKAAPLNPVPQLQQAPLNPPPLQPTPLHSLPQLKAAPLNSVPQFQPASLNPPKLQPAPLNSVQQFQPTPFQHIYQSVNGSSNHSSFQSSNQSIPNPKFIGESIEISNDLNANIRNRQSSNDESDGLGELTIPQNQACSNCKKNIDIDRVKLQCEHYFHKDCFKRELEQLIKKAKTLENVGCPECKIPIPSDSLVNYTLLDTDSKHRAQLLIFQSTLSLCPVCEKETQEKMLHNDLKPRTLKCKQCKTKFCTFCSARGGHRFFCDPFRDYDKGKLKDCTKFIKKK